MTTRKHSLMRAVLGAVLGLGVFAGTADAARYGRYYHHPHRSYGYRGYGYRGYPGYGYARPYPYYYRPYYPNYRPYYYPPPAYYYPYYPGPSRGFGFQFGW